MYQSMSPKRALLIALALWAVVSFAQVSGWTYSNVYNYTNDNKDHLTGIDLNKVVTVQLGKSVFELENRLVYTDRMQNWRQDRFNDRLQLSLITNNGSVQSRIFYRGEFFDKNIGRNFWDNDATIYAKRTFNQQVGGIFSFDNPEVYGTIAARERSFYYNSLTDNENEILEASNINTSFITGYRIIKPLSVFITGSAKQALDTRTDLYDYASGGAGVAIYTPVMFVGHLSGSTRIEWLKSEQLSLDDNADFIKVQNTQRLIPVTSELRYTHMITPKFTSFFSYINRSFYDKNAQEMLLNSNMLRLQMKYTFTYDLSDGTFAEFGGKLCPESNYKYKNSIAFAKAEFQTLPRLYVGGATSFMPDRLNRYEGVIRYYVSAWNEVFLNYIYDDDNYRADNFGTTMDNKYAGVGVRMMF